MRIRTALLAAIASLSLGLTAVPAAMASNGTTVPPKLNTLPPLDTVQVTGLAKNGKQFTGTFAIQRFIVKGDKVYALGTLNGKLKGRHVTRYAVMIPAGLTGSSGGARDAQASPSCQVLHLVLGPVKLNLLGLRVTLGGGAQANQPIVLDITAVPGPGNLLGNLLCDLTNALNQGSALNQGTALSQLSSNLQQLAATLQSLTGILGAL